MEERKREESEYWSVAELGPDETWWKQRRYSRWRNDNEFTSGKSKKRQTHGHRKMPLNL